MESHVIINNIIPLAVLISSALLQWRFSCRRPRLREQHNKGTQTDNEKTNRYVQCTAELANRYTQSHQQWQESRIRLAVPQINHDRQLQTGDDSFGPGLFASRPDSAVVNHSEQLQHSHKLVWGLRDDKGASLSSSSSRTQESMLVPPGYSKQERIINTLKQCVGINQTTSKSDFVANQKEEIAIARPRSISDGICYRPFDAVLEQSIEISELIDESDILQPSQPDPAMPKARPLSDFVMHF